MTAFYKRFGAPDAEQKTDSSSGEDGEVVEVEPLADGAIVFKRAYNMSDGEDGEGGEGWEGMPAAAAAGPAAAAADGIQSEAPAAAAAAEAAA